MLKIMEEIQETYVAGSSLNTNEMSGFQNDCGPVG